MGRMKKYKEDEIPKEPLEPLRPALSPEAREKQMIALAVDLAEKQLREGTASSQVITHYLKLGSIQSQYELEKLKQEIREKEAKVEDLARSKHIEEMYDDAIKAFMTYSGHGDQYENIPGIN